jgi:subtilase family serine protease
VRPKDIRAAYHLPRTGGAGRTVGIVDAFDNPRAASDLNKFRAQYHLPACTVANGCFRKVNQKGDPSPLPPGDPGWGLEIALDLDAVSSACPQCSILLVEARDNSLLNLGRAVDTAVRLGADVVSNSYGADEFSGMHTLAKFYEHPGVPIMAATGDFGFGLPSFPAVLRKTVAVGGTTLVRDRSSSRGWTESAWSGAGSGCSAYVAKPAWQHDTHCPMRVVGDVSAVADPRTGLRVKDSYGFPGTVVVGGTSMSSPLIAAMIAMSRDPGAVDGAGGFYANPGAFNDVVGGSNGRCGKDYLCTGVVGYDAPTGVGTPDGVDGLS